MRAVLLLLCSCTAAIAQEIECYGSVSNGRIEHAVQLPSAGENFESYSSLAELLGRNYVHRKVRDVLLDAFAALAKSHPDWRFKYAETGGKSGGRFRPHKTHQNGLSVDLMIPVRRIDSDEPAMISTNILNKWGYNVEFDKQGRNDDYVVAFDLLAAQLRAISDATKKQRLGIAKVIVTPDFHAALFETKNGAYLRKTLPFMKTEAWVRHDEHFHIDFDYPCKKR